MANASYLEANDPELLTIEEAVSLLKRSVAGSTVRRYIRNGTLPSVKRRKRGKGPQLAYVVRREDVIDVFSPRVGLRGPRCDIPPEELISLTDAAWELGVAYHRLRAFVRRWPTKYPRFWIGSTSCLRRSDFGELGAQLRKSKD
jgi:hypothetical protein